MTRLRVLPLAILASLCFPGSLSAQQDTLATVTEGSRVRVRVPTSPHKSYEGTIVEYGDDRLVLDPTHPKGLGGDVRLNWEDVERLEVSLGTRSNVVNSALIGLGGGAAAGLITAFIWSGGGEAEYSGEGYAILGGIGAGVGLFVGAFIGGASSTEFWREVPLDQITVGPVAKGVVMGLHLRI